MYPSRSNLCAPVTLYRGALAATVVTGFLFVTPVQANNGVMLPAYGAKAMGMGGVSIALPQDAAESANNPAGMAIVGNRQDLDLTIIHAPLNTHVGGNHYSDTALIPIPTGGLNRVLNADMTWGVSVFGQGVALDYGKPVYGTRNTKSKLQQVVIAPTLTWRIAPDQYVGISPRLAYQRGHIAGLENFGFNSDGADKAYGAGFALGYLAKLNDRMSVGATYASPIWFQKLDRYRDLLPDGRLNLPQQAGIGLAYKVIPQLTVAVDALWVNWAGERSYGNRQTEGGALGANDGPGFGWLNQKILRVGASYDIDLHWTVRAGASFSNHFIPDSQATFAALAPLSQYNQYSAGATYRISKGWEITGSYLYATNSELHGTGASSGVSVGTHADYFNLGIGYQF
ncbi:OmpP1/FadL family transporter [Pseudomonas sp. CHM02]|uniref:OmpP1/FadL family transporter n=1 Tax=Pseudomonas sp. CHM02 TaxID=1463662 RepID=UPI000472F8BB|nr:outer membrane protein transport protein [Pseudomonas sp. CHM02]